MPSLDDFAPTSYPHPRSRPPRDSRPFTATGASSTPALPSLSISASASFLPTLSTRPSLQHLSAPSKTHQPRSHESSTTNSTNSGFVSRTNSVSHRSSSEHTAFTIFSMYAQEEALSDGLADDSSPVSAEGIQNANGSIPNGIGNGSALEKQSTTSPPRPPSSASVSVYSRPTTMIFPAQGDPNNPAVSNEEDMDAYGGIIEYPAPPEFFLKKDGDPPQPLSNSVSTSNRNSKSYPPFVNKDEQDVSGSALLSPPSLAHSQSLVPTSPTTEPSPTQSSPDTFASSVPPNFSRPVANAPTSSHISTSSHAHDGPAPSEDPDAYFVRSTYARIEAQGGVPGDGFEEGVERTRTRLSLNRTGQLPEEGLVKGKEIGEKEGELLRNMDRYGFFLSALSSRQESRVVLIPSAPLLKSAFSRRPAISAAQPPSPRELTSLPPSRPPAKEATRIAKWNKMMRVERRDEGGNADRWSTSTSGGFAGGKFAKRVWKGVPDRWRGAVWDCLIEKWESQHGRKGKYKDSELVIQYREGIDKPSSYDVQIDLDVPRTISGHVLFHTRYGQGQRSLFHVLHTFSLLCKGCGYVQGMGPIAATFLFYFDPGRAYINLVRLHDEYEMHDIFMPGFPGLLETIYVQERMIELLMPDVFTAFKKHMISSTAYATKWYITLFANTVPFQTQLRLWDAYLLEGRDVMIVFAVAIIWVFKDHLSCAKANFETILSLLSSFFVPESEDDLLQWMRKTLQNKKLREKMGAWRMDWRQLVASGKDRTALL